MSRVGHLLEMVREAGHLKLGVADTLKYCASYYAPRFGNALHSAMPPKLYLNVRCAGKTFRVPVRSNGFDYELLSEIFAEQFYNPGPIKARRIMDLGANTGFSALYFHALFPNADIACVEPSPASVAALRETLAENGVAARVFDTAVGVEDGRAAFYVSTDPTCSSLVDRSTAAVAERIEVRLTSVPSLLGALGWDGIDLLKIDIEGYERLLLAGSPAWLEGVSVIVGEIHEGYTPEQLRADLEPRGFVVRSHANDAAFGMTAFSAVRK